MDVDLFLFPPFTILTGHRGGVGVVVVVGVGGVRQDRRESLNGGTSTLVMLGAMNN